MLKRYICGQALRESYCLNGGWYLWNLSSKSLQHPSCLNSLQLVGPAKRLPAKGLAVTLTG